MCVYVHPHIQPPGDSVSYALPVPYLSHAEPNIKRPSGSSSTSVITLFRADQGDRVTV